MSKLKSENLNQLCNRDSSGYCYYCQAFAPPTEDGDDFYCLALEEELKNTDYYEDDEQE